MTSRVDMNARYISVPSLLSIRQTRDFRHIQRVVQEGEAFIRRTKKFLHNMKQTLMEDSVCIVKVRQGFDNIVKYRIGNAHVLTKDWKEIKKRLESENYIMFVNATRTRIYIVVD